MPISSSYEELRKDLAEIVFLTAFPLDPTQPKAPVELYHELRPILERCSLWGLLCRMRILDSEHNLSWHVRMSEAIIRASQAIASKQPEPPITPAEEDRFERWYLEDEAEFGPDAEYAEDSQVVHLRLVSLLETVTEEDVEDAEGRDRRRRATNGVTVIEFMAAFLRMHHVHSAGLIDWQRLRHAADSFDQQIEQALAGPQNER